MSADNRETFLQKNAVALIGVAAMLLTNIGAVVYTQGKASERFNAMQLKIAEIDNEGSGYAKATRWVVDTHTTQISELRADSRATAKDVSDIKAQVGVIGNKIDTLTDLLKKQQGATP